MRHVTRMRRGPFPRTDRTAPPMRRDGAAEASPEALNDPAVHVVELRVAARLERAVVDMGTPRLDLGVGEEVNGEHRYVRQFLQSASVFLVDSQYFA